MDVTKNKNKNINDVNKNKLKKIKFKKITSLAFSTPLLISQSGLAEGENRYKIKTLFNQMDQEGSGGTQVIDGKKKQDLKVSEPIVFIGYKITEETNVNFNYIVDSWTSASDKAFDDSTAASFTNKQERKAYNASYAADYKKFGYTISAGNSKESDYESNNFSIGGFKTFADDNFVLGLTYSQFNDKSQLYDVIGDYKKPFKPRDIRALDLSASQILTTHDVLNFGITQVSQSGVLEGTLNTVSVNDIRKEEILPDSRNRSAYFIKWLHAINEENALHFFYRLYQDTWESKANTLEVSYLKSLWEDEGVLEIFARGYQQNDNKYFEKDFDQDEKYMTSDADLSKLSSHQYGFLLEKNFDQQSFTWSIVGGLSSYVRSNDLSYQTGQLGLKVEF